MHQFTKKSLYARTHARVRISLSLIYTYLQTLPFLEALISYSLINKVFVIYVNKCRIDKTLKQVIAKKLCLIFNFRLGQKSAETSK